MTREPKEGRARTSAWTASSSSRAIRTASADEASGAMRKMVFATAVLAARCAFAANQAVAAGVPGGAELVMVFSLQPLP
jgi:hypothetical protein